MDRSLASVGGLAVSLALTALAAASLVPPQSFAQAPAAPAAAQASLAAQDSNVAGVIAELVECRRKEGVLTVKVRFRNTGSDTVRVSVINGRNYDAQYVTAASKKYFVLRDSEKVPLAPAADPGGSVDVSLKPGATWTWWAKYPAPPPEVKDVDYFMSVVPPFEDVPIADQ